MGGGGAVCVSCFKDGGVVFARFSQGVSEEFTAFLGKFSILKAFEIRVWRDGASVGSGMVR